LYEDGSVRSAGPIDETLLSDDMVEEAAKEDLRETKEILDNDMQKPEEAKAVIKLIKDEEKSEGRISRRALFSFFR